MMLMICLVKIFGKFERDSSGKQAVCEPGEGIL